jgi:glutamate--cysteine ligase
MARDVTDDAPVASRTQLVEWLESGSKSPDAFRLGVEHEKFPFYRDDLSPVPYAGRGGRGGIEALLQDFATTGAWQSIEDRGALIGLYDPEKGGAISLEPGGQFELSGAPLESVHETDAEMRAHIGQANRIGESHGIGFLGLGMTPVRSRASIPSMPKSRYRIMMDYMPRVGSLGLDMMLRTCTVQVNLDFADEADMVKKLRVSLALQPMTTALFANSPFTDGKPNGFLSMRSEIWRHTDDRRTGMLPFAFEDGMGFERYVDYALDVPMYFVKRGETYHDVAGASFRDLLEGRLAQLPGERARMSDWANHLSTIFPEVRLKRFLEMRGADMGDAAQVSALPALFAGLLYDGAALDAAWDLVKGATRDDRENARRDAPRLALDAKFGARSLGELARDAVAIAREGLKRRAKRNAAGDDETAFLEPLEERIRRGVPPAGEWLARFDGEWRGSLAPLFEAALLRV